MPGIGQKTAERLAFYILRSKPAEAMAMAYAIRDLKKNVKNCALCNHVTEEIYCSICLDPKRDPALLCVVEQPKDLISIEKMGAYRGRYHVLMGSLALLEGIEVKDLDIEGLLARLQKPFSETASTGAGTPANLPVEAAIREVILATNPNLEGDTTALYLSEKLRNLGISVSTLARGLPTGGSFEFANRSILYEAFAKRRPTAG